MDLRKELEELKASSAAAKASAAAEKASLAAQVAALQAALSSVPLHGGGGGGEGAPLLPLPLPLPLNALPRNFKDFDRVLACTAERVVDSPTKGTTSLQGPIACLSFSALPLEPDLEGLSAASSLQCWAAMALGATLQEESAYPIATAFVPDWIKAETRPAHLSKGCRAASTLYLKEGRAQPRFPRTRVTWTSKPELLTVPKESFHPAFTGEIKSAISSGEGSSPKLFEELLNYGLLAMLGSYFQDVPTGCHRFFRAPPRAFALAGLAHVGYLVAMEWVGKVHGSVVSEPFFLGSPAHKAAVERLPDSHQAGAFVDVNLVDIDVSAWPPQPGAAARVVWRTQPPPPPPAATSSAPPSPTPPAARYQGQFFKLIPDHAFEAADFRRMHAAYGRLRTAWLAGPEQGNPPPPALLPAELLFSAGLVGVFMPWVQGRSVEPSELGAGGLALAPVVDAIVWLARQGLLYTDLRAPNVLVREGGEGGEEGGAAASVVLIDYDDMLCLEAPPANGEELCALLEAEVTALYAAPAGEPGALPDIMEALRAQVW